MVLGPKFHKPSTADTDLDKTCVGVAGKPRLGMVNAQGTDRDVSSEGADPIGVWARVFSSSSAKAMMRKNGTVKK